MGFLQSPEFIYKKMQFAGQAARWAEQDWFTFFSRLNAQGFVWDSEDQRLRQKGWPALMANTPWCHTASSWDKHCSLDHNIIFNNWGIIHPRCIECWKVVVTPRTFHELMLLEQLEAQLGFDSKCGIEMRDYTPKFYGGYFYNSSLDAGRARWKEVKDAVSEFISPEVGEGVILKRGCTEYEMINGPSLYWTVNPDQKRLLDMIEAFVDVKRGHGEQSMMLKRNVHLKWLLWAHFIGDMTYKDYNGGQSLFPGYVKYHEGDIGDIKHDLAIAQAQASVGLPPEVSSAFIETVQNFAKQYKIPEYGHLVRALGTHDSGEMNMRFKMQEVPEEQKGDQNGTT